MSPRGLPGRLPEGEVLLWQGAPDPRVLARSALHVRGLLIYFAVLAIATVTAGRLQSALVLLGLAAVPVALAYGYAWLVARATVYTITNRRVALRIGLALPVTLNLPLARVASVDVRSAADGSGDVSLTPEGGRFAYLVLWPHARPWCFSPAQPTLRGLADAGAPAAVLAGLLPAMAPGRIETQSGYDGMQTPLAA